MPENGGCAMSKRALMTCSLKKIGKMNWCLSSGIGSYECSKNMSYEGGATIVEDARLRGSLD